MSLASPRSTFPSSAIRPIDGLPAAASIVLFAIIFVVTLLQMQVAKRRVHYQ
jgi:ABC-type sugar transport system permease subunit